MIKIQNKKDRIYVTKISDGYLTLMEYYANTSLSADEFLESVSLCGLSITECVKVYAAFKKNVTGSNVLEYSEHVVKSKGKLVVKKKKEQLSRWAEHIEKYMEDTTNVA